MNAERFIMKFGLKVRNVKFSKSSITPQILPGMLAQVEIIGKKRTIFEYLMKPVLKTTSRALTENKSLFKSLWLAYDGREQSNTNLLICELNFKNE